MNNVIEQYQHEGYYLAKKIFEPKQAQEANEIIFNNPPPKEEI